VAVAGRFGADEAPAYDVRMDRLVPGYRLLHRLVRAELTAALPESAHVLVVGAGTGAELDLLATARPQWRFTAVDPVGPMLEVAQGKAAAGGYLDRVTWHCGYASDLDAAAGFDAGFDAAVMILVAHFLAADAKQALFTDVAARLRPGAPLVFADLAEAAEPDSPLAAVRREVALDLGCSGAEVDAMITNMWRTLHPVDGPRLAELLTAAGLGTARTFFRVLGYHGAVAVRSAAVSP
jgi:tRNA (cmo5U34)-methyltransferase